MEGLSEFQAHLNVQVVLLLQALFSCFDSILDHLLELSRLNFLQNICNPLAVETIPIAFIRKVPEGDYRGLGQVKHALNGEALDLRHSSHKNLVPANVLKCIVNYLIYLPL